jgi:hypothetical protein
MPPSIQKHVQSLWVIVLLLFPVVSLFWQLSSLTVPLADVEDHAAISSGATPWQPDRRPLLRSILNFTSGEIVGDPQFLLDFAIVGFPKCGTTALQAWLSQHAQIEMLHGEVFALLNKQPERLVWRLYTQLPSSNHVVRGYKNPLDLRAPPTLEYLTRYFPKTTLIVGIRHPVHWFESLYNFKVQNLARNVDPGYWGDPNTLLRSNACEQWNDTNCVGVAKGWFHVYLAALGKVPYPGEWKEEYPMYLTDSRPRVPNPVFLYESQQLVFGNAHDIDNTATSSTSEYARQFRIDLQRLLGLNDSLPVILPRTKPDLEHFSKRQQQRKIRICHAKYLPLRTELMRIARQASVWIRKEFLKSPDVHISSPDYFQTLLQGWMVDPCEKVKVAEGNNSEAHVSAL